MTITQDSSASLFAVIGSTGTQGGSVIKALKASSKPYRIRAITRDAAKPAAQELQKLGCEIVAGDVDSGATLERAFEGATYVFGMTVSDYSTSEVKAKEYAQGKAQVDAAKSAGVKTFVWAGLTDMKEASGGKISVDTFDAKAQVTSYARSVGDLEVIDVRPGGYASNNLYMPGFQPTKGENGTCTLAMALDLHSPYAVIDMVSDYGRFAVSAIESETRPETVYASAEYTTPAKMAEELSRVSGKKVNFFRVPDDVLYKNLSAHNQNLANNIGPMFQAIQSVGYYNGQDLAESNKLLSSPAVTFGQYLDANKETLAKLLA